MSQKEMLSRVTYINIWTDRKTGKCYTREADICESRKAAIADYHQGLDIQNGRSNYIETQVGEQIIQAGRVVSGNFYTIDLEEELQEEKEPDSFNESDSDLKREEEAGIC